MLLNVSQIVTHSSMANCRSLNRDIHPNCFSQTADKIVFISSTALNVDNQTPSGVSPSGTNTIPDVSNGTDRPDFSR
jgi:hypothetical protein